MWKAGRHGAARRRNLQGACSTPPELHAALHSISSIGSRNLSRVWNTHLSGHAGSHATLETNARTARTAGTAGTKTTHPTCRKALSVGPRSSRTGRSCDTVLLCSATRASSWPGRRRSSRTTPRQRGRSSWCQRRRGAGRRILGVTNLDACHLYGKQALQPPVQGASEQRSKVPPTTTDPGPGHGPPRPKNPALPSPAPPSPCPKLPRAAGCVLLPVLPPAPSHLTPAPSDLTRAPSHLTPAPSHLTPHTRASPPRSRMAPVCPGGRSRS